MATHELKANLLVPVHEDADHCHTRWHPDIPPALTCNPGDEVLLTTRDAVDGQFSLASTHEDVSRSDRSLVCPLTGPIAITDARPGDLLAVDILDVTPGTFGYTAIIPGFGFLRDEFTEPFLARWKIVDGWATSDDLPGIRIPGAPFMGTIGVAPSHDLLERISLRERSLGAAGEDVALPDPRGAVPADNAIARTGLRTRPPREHGGNVDVKQLTAGSRVLFPVWTEGALFSAGDAHFAQGDGESCGTAIETSAVLRVRFELLEGAAAAAGIRDIRFSGMRATTMPGPYVATTGLSVYADGPNHPEDLNSAARCALTNMIDLLVGEYGYTRQQAYAICSVAVDLRIAQVVDLPSFIVTAELPLSVLTEP
jgi:formamidase